MTIYDGHQKHIFYNPELIKNIVLISQYSIINYKFNRCSSITINNYLLSVIIVVIGTYILIHTV